MNGGYKTENRKRILRCLIDHEDTGLSVKEIHQHMEEAGYPVNLTTIYRYLDKLEKEGNIVRCVSEKGGRTTFQYARDDHHCEDHLHLQCLECGRIFHLDCAFMDKIAEHIAEDHGFAIQCKNSIIYGVCEDCRKKKKKV